MREGLLEFLRESSVTRRTQRRIQHYQSWQDSESTPSARRVVLYVLKLAAPPASLSLFWRLDVKRPPLSRCKEWTNGMPHAPRQKLAGCLPCAIHHNQSCEPAKAACTAARITTRSRSFFSILEAVEADGTWLGHRLTSEAASYRAVYLLLHR